MKPISKTPITIVEAFKSVIAHKQSNMNLSEAVITDEYMCDDVNTSLVKEDRITPVQFNRWKIGIVEPEDPITKAEANEIAELLLSHRQVRLQWALNQMEKDHIKERWAWIIERRFPEFDLKRLSNSTKKKANIVSVKEKLEQFELAMNGDSEMLIELGKQRLGQTDKVITNITYSNSSNQTKETHTDE